MLRLKRLKTLILGLAVILITFTIFIALPAILPSLGSLSCEKVMWACTHRGIPPVIYDTWTWYTPEQPDYEEWKEAHYRVEDTDDILDGLHRTVINKGLGTLNIIIDPEDENRINVSGYLQYGFFTKPENIETENMTGIVSKFLPDTEMQGVLQYRSINIELINVYKTKRTTEEFEVYTDKNGFFTITLEPDDEAVFYTFVAFFETEIFVPKNIEEPVEVYLETKITYTTYKSEYAYRKPIPWWTWLVTVLAIIAAWFWLTRYLKRFSKYIPESLRKYIWEIEKEPQPRAEEIKTTEVLEKKEEEAGGDLLQVEISFPDIGVLFPAVWGMGEPLTVLVQFKDMNGEILSSQPGNVELGDGEKVQVTSDADGQIWLEHIFTIKGEYVIIASYTDKRTGKAVSSWRKIGIVEYREEMVRLFNEMLETLNIKDIRIEPEMTAREVEALLAERLKGVSGETIRKVVAGFEEANYSIHPVTRESYVAMYPAVREVLGYGG